MRRSASILRGGERACEELVFCLRHGRCRGHAGGGSAGAKGVNKAASNNGELKIYGIEWSNSTDGIKEIIDERLKTNDSDVYNLNGQKVDGMPTKKGVYIKDGKKVLVK